MLQYAAICCIILQTDGWFAWWCCNLQLVCMFMVDIFSFCVHVHTLFMMFMWSCDQTRKLIPVCTKTNLDLSCLPRVTLSDVPRTGISYSVEQRFLGESKDVPLYTTDQPTNGIAYMRGVIGLGNVSEELRPYVPLFCSVRGKNIWE